MVDARRHKLKNVNDLCSKSIKLSLASPGVAKSSTSFGWGKGGNVTSVGWQVTLCDPVWHVSSRSGVALLHCELLYQYNLLLLYLFCNAV